MAVSGALEKVDVDPHRQLDAGNRSAEDEHSQPPVDITRRTM
jgi:hypothetical protein